MVTVHLRPITKANLDACLGLSVHEDQQHLVPTTAKALAHASVDPRMTPLAIYDGAALGHERPLVPMVGFAMYEVADGVGLILLLLIDRQYQGKGYGRASLAELIRRLHLEPCAEVIAISHAKGNEAAAKLYQSFGFVPWEIHWTEEDPDEVYLRLP
jgi:diamine N-acetyltransferase